MYTSCFSLCYNKLPDQEHPKEGKSGLESQGKRAQFIVAGKAMAAGAQGSLPTPGLIRSRER